MRDAPRPYFGNALFANVISACTTSSDSGITIFLSAGTPSECITTSVQSDAFTASTIAGSEKPDTSLIHCTPKPSAFCAVCGMARIDAETHAREAKRGKRPAPAPAAAIPPPA